jgi:Ca-activated chloride channel homolog
VKTLLLVLALSSSAWAYYPMDMWKAQRQAANGKWAEAAALYRAALKERPDSSEALYNLGLCLYRQGQFEEAASLFAKAQELAPAGPLKGQAAYNLGNTRYQLKKLPEALEAYKVALRWNELDDDARFNIQVILDQMKNPPDKNKDKDKDKDKDKNKDKDKDKGKSSPTPTPTPNASPTPTPTPQGSPTPTPTAQGQQSPQPKPANPQEQRDREEAERLLQFFQNRERQAQKRRLPARPGAPTGVDDW